VELLENKSKQSEFANKNRMNLLVKESQQRHFIIEIQAQQVAGYLERQLIGVSNAMMENLELGRSYRDVKKVISVSILYFNVGLREDYLYHGSTSFKGLHTHNSLKFSMIMDGKWQARNVFPEYYLISVESFKDVITSDLDEWIYLLKQSNTRP
jgi:PD-(D/E)XK nuclease family transposase